MAGVPLPSNASGLFAADEEQQAKDAATQQEADRIAAQQQVPITTGNLVSAMQAAQSPAQQNLAAAQIPPTPRQLAAADQNAAALVPASGTPGATTQQEGGTNPPPQAAVPQVAPVELESRVHKKDDKTTSIAPEQLANVYQSGKRAEEAAKNVGTAEVQAANAQIAAKKAASEYQMHQADLAATAEKTRQGIIQGKTDELNSLQQDYEKATIDPNRYWKNTSMGGKIGSLVAIALSGLGNSYAAAASPGSNPQGNDAWNIIKGQIDNDIDAQKANIDKQGRAVNARSSELNALTTRLGDQRQAELALAAQRYDAFGKQLEAEAAKSNNPLYIARAEKVVADGVAARDEKLAQLSTNIHTNANDETFKQVLPKAAKALGGNETFDKLQLNYESSAVEANHLINNIDKMVKKDGSTAFALKSKLKSLGISTDEDYNKLDPETKILKAREVMGLYGTVTRGTLQQMAELSYNPFASPAILRATLDQMKEANIRQGIDQRHSLGNTYDLGVENPAFSNLKQQWQRQQSENTALRSRK